MAGFCILDYIPQLERYGEVKNNGSWIEATCPICGGKLKIRTTADGHAPYSCFTNSCHELRPNPIRKLLYRPNSFNAKNSFSVKLTRPYKLTEIVKPKYVQDSIYSFLSKVPYVPPKRVKFEDRIFTYFSYEDFRVTRVDYILDGVKQKVVYPEYYDATSNIYVKGVPSDLTDLPIYRKDYLQENILLGEGEKVATIGQRLGLAALTFPSFLYSEMYLERAVRNLKAKGVKNVLYLTDNDEAGFQKAKKVLNLLWKYSIGANQINLAQSFNEYKDVSGFDLADCFSLHLIDNSNVVEVLEQAYAYH